MAPVPALLSTEQYHSRISAGDSPRSRRTILCDAASEERPQRAIPSVSLEAPSWSDGTHLSFLSSRLDKLLREFLYFSRNLPLQRDICRARLSDVSQTDQ